MAIFETVCPGDRVLDLGTGTGILSQWALEAGASHVVGMDLSMPVLAQAEARMKQARLADRFQPIHALSYDVSLPEPVDVLISEIIGNMADNENFQPILHDAIQRFLKPQGKLLPQATRSYLVPVAARNAHADLSAGKVFSITTKCPSCIRIGGYPLCLISTMIASCPAVFTSVNLKWQPPIWETGGSLRPTAARFFLSD